MWEGTLTLDSYKKEELGDPTLLSFLLIESVKPLYEQCVSMLQEFFVPDFWKQGHCPVCGEFPPIAQISLQKGTKLLFCTHCGMEWPFPLLHCPFCNHEEEDTKYLRVKNEKQYRIEVCKACEKYLKAVDPELFGSRVPLDIENIVTLHLDILAQQQGYRRGSSFPLLL
jgi:FdhE protein